jgi:hypothetical protein
VPGKCGWCQANEFDAEFDAAFDSVVLDAVLQQA